MSELELKRGSIYRAKRPLRVTDFFKDFVNDRQIMYVGADMVQYDSPSVPRGRHYPTVTKEAFLKWAGRELTAEETQGDEWDVWKEGKGANK